jgi:hypothetical protein
MRAAAPLGPISWLLARALVLIGGLACHTAPPIESPTAAPVVPAPAPVSREPPTPTPEPATTKVADLDEGWSLPAGLLEPAPEAHLEWELPAPAGEAAPNRRPSPSQPQWEGMVDPAPSAPPAVDEVSRPCRRAHFLAHDTRPLRTVELRYDAAGRRVFERTDDDTDGTMEFESTWSYGADGRLERERHVTASQPSCGGRIPESVTETRHRYDAHGVWIGGQNRYDGRPEEQTAWRTTTYDAEGRLVHYLVHPTHEPQRTLALRWGDGELLERVDHTGPTPRRIERWHVAADGSRWHAMWEDGKPWTVTRTVQRADGQPQVIQHDVDGDGRVDGRTLWTYDDKGRQLVEERDTDGDGDADEHTTYAHDDVGYLAGRVHTGLEGTRRETWQYAPGGQLLRRTSKLDESWVEDVEEHVYDAGGHEIERRTDLHHAVGSVGDLRSYVTHEHWHAERDGEGRRVREFVAQGEIGPDERVEYSYDCKKPYRRYPRRNLFDRGQCSEF